MFKFQDKTNLVKAELKNSKGVAFKFLENGSIAYYIERGKDRHKGVVEFDKRNIQPVLKPLLTA